MQYEAKTFVRNEGVRLHRFAAANIQEARKKAGELGDGIISLQPLRLRIASPDANFDSLMFCYELVALLEAGLGLVESLEIIGRNASAVALVAQNVARRLREGISLSQALEEMPQAIPVLLISLIRASEQTGDLVESIKRYVTHEQHLNQIRNRVVSALVYPALLVVVGIAVIIFLLAYVVPRFSRIYDDLGTELSWTSRLMVDWTHFVSQHGTLMLALAVSSVCVIVVAVANRTLRSRAEKILWDMPALGDKFRIYQLTQFTRTLAMLIKGGIPFVSALDMVASLLRQSALQSGLANASQAIRAGKPISESFARAGLADEVGIRLIAVGENSGGMGEALDRIATLYDDQIARWIDRFSRLFEPLLMLGIGVAIGLIVILMYLPVFELANSLQ